MWGEVPALPDLKWLHLESVHVLHGELMLDGPGTLGNILRSVVGLALHQDAPTTAELFMGRASDSDAMRPWWMWPQEPDGWCLAAGSMLRVRWSLSAVGLPHLAPLVQALEGIGRLGLGSNRVKADLTTVQLLSPYGPMPLASALEPNAMWGAHLLWRHACAEAVPLMTGAKEASSGPENRVWIRAHTPLRLKRRGELLLEAPSLDQLIAACIGRLDALARLAPGFVARDDTVWLERQVWVQWAQRFAALQPDTDGVSLSRWSSRQRRSMVLTGLRGVWSYDASAVLALPWLRLAEHLQLGGKTSFGMGTLQIELPQSTLISDQQGEESHDTSACSAV